MKIEWSEEDVTSGVLAVVTTDPQAHVHRDAVRAAMTRGVVLFLASASGRVAEDAAALNAILDYARQCPSEQAAAMDALPRLYALAQEAERYRQERDALNAECARLSREGTQEAEALRAKVAQVEALKAGTEVAWREEMRLHREARSEVEKWQVATACSSPDEVSARARGLREAVAAANTRAMSAESEATTLRTAWGREVKDREAAEAEVERLKARMAGLTAECDRRLDRVDAAESRLAAIRETLRDMAEDDDAYAPVPADFKAGWHAARKHVVDALEGDAPNSPEVPDGSGNTGMPSKGSSEAPPTIAELEEILAAPEGTYRIEVQPNGEIRSVKRHPCSPACTHDDARNPGHPERVKERSEAVKALHPNGACCCEGEGYCAWCLDTATREEMEAAFDRGAEAMRAACWEAVQRVAHTLALGPTEREMLRAAIEVAKP